MLVKRLLAQKILYDYIFSFAKDIIEPYWGRGVWGEGRELWSLGLPPRQKLSSHCGAKGRSRGRVSGCRSPRAEDILPAKRGELRHGVKEKFLLSPEKGVCSI